MVKSEEGEGEIKMSKKDKEIGDKLHFVEPINYASEEEWRTDFKIGLKGSKEAGHLALSGGGIWYLRDEENNEIIKDGKISK